MLNNINAIIYKDLTGDQIDSYVMKYFMGVNYFLVSIGPSEGKEAALRTLSASFVTSHLLGCQLCALLQCCPYFGSSCSEKISCCIVVKTQEENKLALFASKQ
jgi:hypothetical protein